jgi:hypothetical protein
MTTYEIGQTLLENPAIAEHPRTVTLIDSLGRDEAARLVGEQHLKNNPHLRRHVTAEADALRTDSRSEVEEQAAADEPFRLPTLMPYQSGQGMPDLGATGVNLPLSSLNAGLRLIEDIPQLPESLSAMKDVGLGLLSKMGPGGVGPSRGGAMFPEQEQMVDDMVRGIAQFASDPENIARLIQNEPGEVAMATLGAAHPGLAGGKVRTLSGMLNPARLPRTIASRSPREGMNLTPATPMAATTGTSEAALEEAWRSGVAGGRRSELFREGIRTTISTDRAGDMLQEFLGAFKTLREKRTAQYAENLKGLRRTGDLDVALTNTRVQLRQMLENMKIGFYETSKRHPPTYKDFDKAGDPSALGRYNPEVSSPGARRRVQQPPKSPAVTGQIDHEKLQFFHSNVSSKADQAAMREIVKTIEEWDFTSVEGMDRLKKKLWDFVPKGEADVAQGAAKGMWGHVRDHLSKSVKGYDKLASDFKVMTDLMEQVMRTFNLPVGTKDFKKSLETTISKIDNVMGDNKEYARSLVAAMEEITGEQFIPKMSGLSLRSALPASLVGRSGVARGMRAVISPAASAIGIGAATGGSSAFVFALPFFSPKLVGEMLHVTGRVYGWPKRSARKMGDEVTKVLDKIEAKYPNIPTGRQTVGQILSAVDPEDAALYNHMIQEALTPGDPSDPESVFRGAGTALEGARGAARTVDETSRAIVDAALE